ncbi:MAG: hypothetical protein JKY31_00755 [Rhodobacteraceae bacterium]|nr:hypothetical protein [Paracoccaceae bacterium]
MKSTKKWTVRDMPEHTLTKIREVKETSTNYTMANLIEEAVDLWYDQLPTEF